MMSAPSRNEQTSTQIACTQQTHDRLKADDVAWLRATLRGYQPGVAPTDLYEMRLCPRCGSALVRAVKIVELRYVREPRVPIVRRLRTRAHA